MSVPKITDELPISIRAFAQPNNAKLKTGPPQFARRKETPPSVHTFIFDCETTTDSAQSLRFGTYQHRNDGELAESGIFYSPGTLSWHEINRLKIYAERHGLECLTHSDFIDRKFYGIAYDSRATIVGFNLPFDISRIAIRHSSAKGNMKGGFTFTLSDDKRLPPLRVKHLSAKAAFIQFQAPFKNRTNRGQRKRGNREPARRGHFVDCKTLASALLAKSFSLETLCAALNVDSPKHETPDFSAAIDNDFIEYAVRDTQATWECYVALIAKFDGLRLADAEPSKMYSEASLGKAGLRSMAIQSWQQCQPKFDPAITGKIMAAYFGGRSEIGIRRSERQVMLCDFLSMYPTVCTLMGLWQFVIAKGVQTTDATDDARALLDAVTLSDLQAKPFWRKLTMLVRVKPDADIFPIRAHYGQGAQPTIGLNYLSSENGHWFTLADCIASKLLTGKAPQILEAISFAPMDKQHGLVRFKINGNDAYAIDPANDDYYKRLIELRQARKAKMRGASAADRAALDTQQNSLKIMANATSYGIFVELNVEDAAKNTELDVYNGSGDAFTIKPNKVEKPGPYFHPLLATLITGAARLMLAITETLAIDRELNWSFCDTDSMALAKPDALDSGQFANSVQSIIDWFSELNPYCFGGSILKSEDVNYSLSSNGELDPLYCFALSSKRYALYNLDSDGKPIIRKASAHGLGQLRPPYDKSNPAPNMPNPQIDLAKAGISLWQHDLWIKIIEGGKSDIPLQVDLDYHPNLQLPGLSRYAATSPHLLRWFDKYNAGRSYIDQVKPFGFLTALIADNFETGEIILSEPLNRRKVKSPIRPIAPFTTDPTIAGRTAFDRLTREPVPSDRLKSYADQLRQYHLQPENKFLNGNYTDSGKTVRRYIRAIRAMHIGKEANDLERQVTLGYDSAAQPAYGYCPNDVNNLHEELKRVCKAFSVDRIARYSRLSRKFISKIVKSKYYFNSSTIDVMEIEKVCLYHVKIQRKQQINLVAFKILVVDLGLRQAARFIGKDPSNLKRLLF